MTDPDIQLIANVVAVSPDGRVALTRYDTDDDRWWLPGTDLEPYEHPDGAARRVIADLGLTGDATLAGIESFRGRRGWHVAFNYRCQAEAAGHDSWFDPTELPPTRHGAWEAEVIRSVTGA
jgi:ADP-ribose pyrophosphatase YjhB (NUDIX family)